MKVLKKVTSIILVLAILLLNSKSLVVYANEQITESDLIITEENIDNSINIDSTELKEESNNDEKTKEGTSKETDDIKAPVLDISSLQVDKKELKSGEKVKISLKITDDNSGVESVSVSYCEPITKKYKDIDMYYNSKNDRYERNLYINDTMALGMWKINRLYIDDKAGNFTIIYNTHTNTDDYGFTKEDLSAGDFNVVGTNPDIEPPVLDLSSLQVNKKELKRGEKLTISAKITDDKSEIEHVSVYYYEPITGNREYIGMYYNRERDRYEGSTYIDDAGQEGIWKIYNLTIGDNAGNYIEIYNTNVDTNKDDLVYVEKDLSAGDFKVSGTIIDEKAPEFRGISIDKKVLRPGDKATISVDMVDDESGIDLDYFFIDYISETNSLEDSSFVQVSEAVYNEKTKKYDFDIEIDGTMLNGVYRIHSMSVADNTWNCATFKNYGENRTDLSAADFEVVDSTNGYEQLIKSVKIDNNKPKVGDIVNLSVELANNSYIGTLQLGYSYNVSIEEYKDINLKYNEATNRYEGKLTIDNSFETGIWIPYSIDFKSYSGKWLNYMDAEYYGLADKLKFEVVEKESETTNGIVYRTHVQDYGWQDWKSNGEMSGTSGESKRLEGIEIKADNLPQGASIKYRTHVQDYGWQDWKSNGEMSGTSGESKRLEGIEIKLENAPGYSVEYRTHVQDYGWQDWKRDGEMSGTSGESKRLEGIEIRIVKDATVEYRTHVQDYGWQDWKGNGEMSGTSGESKRLEGIEIKADNLPEGASIKYRTHVQDYGWQDWKSNGEMSGTSGESKRLEGIEIKLENAPGYSIEYRTHVQDYGWQEWKRDGEMSGTSGESKRLEGIEIRIVKK